MLLGAWVTGIVLLILRVDLAWLFLVPGLAHFARGIWRTPRWRERAFDGLEEHSAQMTAQEREEHIAKILRVYGGKPFPKVKRRVAKIRRLPAKEPPADRWRPS